MSNPARELHVIFTAWREANNSRAVSLGSIVELDGASGVDELLHVFGLLNAIRTAINRAELETGDDLTTYRATFPDWVRIAAGYSHGWQTTATSSTFVPAVPLTLLSTLALYLSGKTFDLPADGPSQLSKSIAEARTLVEGSDELPQQLRLYIFQIIQECETALGNDRVGVTFDFESAIMRLFTAFQSAGLMVTDPKKKSAFGKLAADVLRSAAVNSTTRALTAGGEAGFNMLLELSSKLGEL